MRMLYFEMVEESKEKINECYNKVNGLNNIDGLFFRTYPIREEDDKQHKFSVYVSKSTRKVTWSDVYRMINEIKVCDYRFKNI